MRPKLVDEFARDARLAALLAAESVAEIAIEAPDERRRHLERSLQLSNAHKHRIRLTSQPGVASQRGRASCGADRGARRLGTRACGGAGWWMWRESYPRAFTTLPALGSGAGAGSDGLGGGGAGSDSPGGGGAVAEQL